MGATYGDATYGTGTYGIVEAVAAMLRVDAQPTTLVETSADPTVRVDTIARPRRVEVDTIARPSTLVHVSDRAANLSGLVAVIGNKHDLDGTFRTRAGRPVDPTTVRCVVEAPDGTNTTYVLGEDDELVRVAAGRYRATFTPDQTGDWDYRFEGEGNVEAAGEGTFSVEASRIE